MRVVCISCDPKKCHKDVKPAIIGRIYTVIDTKPHTEWNLPGYKITPGTYYKVIEKYGWHHESIFVPIIEDQQDETEFERNYQKETV